MQCFQRQLSLWCRAYAVNGRHSCLAVRTTSRSALAPSRAVPEAQVSTEPKHFSDERSSSNDSTSTSAPTMTPAQVKRKGPKQRYRLDEYCLLQYPQFSRNVIQSWILQGKVFVDEKPVLKSGHQVRKQYEVCLPHGPVQGQRTQGMSPEPWLCRTSSNWCLRISTRLHAASLASWHAQAYRWPTPYASVFVGNQHVLGITMGGGSMSFTDTLMT